MQTSRLHLSQRHHASVNNTLCTRFAEPTSYECQAPCLITRIGHFMWRLSAVPRLFDKNLPKNLFEKLKCSGKFAFPTSCLSACKGVIDDNGVARTTAVAAVRDTPGRLCGTSFICR